MRKRQVTFRSKQGKYDLPLYSLPSVKNGNNVEEFPIRLIWDALTDEWRLDVGYWKNKKPQQLFCGNSDCTLKGIAKGLIYMGEKLLKESEK